MLRRAATLLMTVLCLAGTAFAQSGAVEIEIIDVAPPKPAPAPAAGPRLDDVFKSMGKSGRPASTTRATPILIAAAGLIGTAVATSQWNKRRAAKPRPVGDHRKLLDEIARASGLSRRQLKRLEAAARAGGLSSPIVAAICPSVLFARAGAARSGTERSMWIALSRQVARRVR